ncbi:hypothetical protein CC79DRAFT_1368294 [Sarocladium strictum]
MACLDYTPPELPAIEHQVRELCEFVERAAFPRSNPVDLKKEQLCRALDATPSTLTPKKGTSPEPVAQPDALIDSTAGMEDVVEPDRAFEKGTSDEHISLGRRFQDTRRQSPRLAKRSRYIRCHLPTARRTVIRHETAQFPARAQKSKRRLHPIEVIVPSRDMRLEKLDYDGFLHDKDDEMTNGIGPAVTNKTIFNDTNETAALVTGHKASRYQRQWAGCEHEGQQKGPSSRGQRQPRQLVE